MNTPIFIIGMPGTGKSKLGKGAAKNLGIPFVDLDSYIMLYENKTIANLFQENGEDHFRTLETFYLKQLIEEFGKKHTIYICATGGGSPCYNNNILLMIKTGRVICLKLDAEKNLKRLLNAAPDKRPAWQNLNESEARKLFETLISRRKSIYEKAESQLLLVDNYKIDLENLIGLIVST